MQCSSNVESSGVVIGNWKLMIHPSELFLLLLSLELLILIRILLSLIVFAFLAVARSMSYRSGRPSNPREGDRMRMRMGEREPDRGFNYPLQVLEDLQLKGSGIQRMSGAAQFTDSTGHDSRYLSLI